MSDVSSSKFGRRRAMVATAAIAFVLAAIPVAAPAPSAAPFFVQFGALPSESFSWATGISGDGNTVVGTSEMLQLSHVLVDHQIRPPEPSVGIRWTEAGGVERLSADSDTNRMRSAIAASYDGSVIVGDGVVPTGVFGVSPYVATRWTSTGGVQGLGALTPNLGSGPAVDVSADGSVVVGGASIPAPFGGFQAPFRWTDGSGMVNLGGFAGGSQEGRARVISADGSIIFGVSNVTPGTVYRAFMWTEATGLVAIPGSVSGISADGTTFVGSYGNGRAVRWTAAGGAIDLGQLNDLGIVSATDVSGDGSVVVGRASADNPEFEAGFVWDANHGMRDIHDVLAEAGLGDAIAGRYLTIVTAVSDDGLVFAGILREYGIEHGWVANLRSGPTGPIQAATIAEPARISVLMLGLFFVVLATWRTAVTVTLDLIRGFGDVAPGLSAKASVRAPARAASPGLPDRPRRARP